MKKETVTTNQITEGVIWKQLLLFFFPIVLGTFFQQLYNTADTIVVGRFVSKEALAAVGGSAAQIVGLIVGFFVGLASGASVIISQFYGAKNRVQLNRALHTAYAFSIIGSIFITVLGILIAPWMLELMHTPQETMADALLYLRIYFAGIIFVFISILIGFYVLYSLIAGTAEHGWASLMLSVWFVGGVVLMSIGAVGLYIGKIYKEVNHRPLYNVEEVLCDEDKQSH